MISSWNHRFHDGLSENSIKSSILCYFSQNLVEIRISIHDAISTKNCSILTKNGLFSPFLVDFSSKSAKSGNRFSWILQKNSLFLAKIGYFYRKTAKFSWFSAKIADFQQICGILVKIPQILVKSSIFNDFIIKYHKIA